MVEKKYFNGGEFFFFMVEKNYLINGGEKLF